MYVTNGTVKIRVLNSNLYCILRQQCGKYILKVIYKILFYLYTLIQHVLVKNSCCRDPLVRLAIQLERLLVQMNYLSFPFQWL